MSNKSPVEIIRDIAQDPLPRMAGVDVESWIGHAIAYDLNLAARGLDIVFRPNRRSISVYETREGGIDRAIGRGGHIARALKFMLDSRNHSEDAEREARKQLNRAIINKEWRRVRKTKAGKAMIASLEAPIKQRERIEEAQRTIDAQVRATSDCRDVPVDWPTEWRQGLLRPIANAPTSRVSTWGK